VINHRTEAKDVVSGAMKYQINQSNHKIYITCSKADSVKLNLPCNCLAGKTIDNNNDDDDNNNNFRHKRYTE